MLWVEINEMKWNEMKLLSLSPPQDTACSHITDEDTTITVTPILYDNDFYVQCAVASKYEYHSDLADAATDLFSSTASPIETEVKGKRTQSLVLFFLF